VQLQIAPSTYYDLTCRLLSARQLRDKELGPALKKLREKNDCVYGRRKLTKAAHRSGLAIERHQVA
jgi:hypothetical protein